MAKETDLRTMTMFDIPAVVRLIEMAMNREEAEWAERSMTLHFELAEQGVSDGRDYFVWHSAEEIAGIIGLHHYDWGPRENVWLSWFAVLPELQGNGIGKKMFAEMMRFAREHNYKKLFVETYSSDTFEKARRFYISVGMEQVGSVEDYLPDKSAMIVFKMDLD